MTEGYSDFNRLVEIMKRLRAPAGCPWDAEQTHESLKRYLVEECYEVIEAIENKDDLHLKEELGDLLLQPVFHAVIAEESGRFGMNDIIEGLCSKLIRRHPHVFADKSIRNSAEQVENWERIKQEEKAVKRSALEGIPPHLPALLKAQKITEKASRVGFDWESRDQVIEKVREELQELLDAINSADSSHINAEFGDLLFSMVNLGRFLDVNAEDSLRAAIEKFRRRFAHIEDRVGAMGIDIKDTTLEEMESFWLEAKGIEERK